MGSIPITRSNTLPLDYNNSRDCGEVLHRRLNTSFMSVVVPTARAIHNVNGVIGKIKSNLVVYHRNSSIILGGLDQNAVYDSMPI